MLITILNILLFTMQNVLHLLFYYIKIEKHHYFLKYLKRWPQYGGQEKYKDINIYTTAIIIYEVDYKINKYICISRLRGKLNKLI